MAIPDASIRRRPRRLRRTMLRIGYRTYRKPKKPCPPFGAYVKEYRRTNPMLLAKAKDVVRAAANNWKTLSPDVKSIYKRRVAGEMTQFRTELAQWNRKKRFMKQAPSPYALFTKDVWIREANRVPFVEMSRHVSQLWRAMTDREKSVYRNRYLRAKNVYINTVRQYGNGMQVDLDRQLDVDEADRVNIGGRQHW